MSKAMQEATPAISQMRTAPPAPPTGPERKVPAANSAALASVITPPLEPMMLTGAAIPRPSSSAVSVSR